MLRNVCVSQAEPIAAVRHAERRSTGNDPVEIAWITLRRHQRLPAAIGTAIEVGVAPGLPVILHRNQL